MIRFTWWHSGALFGVRYEIPANERLPTHAHEAPLAHDVFVLKGRVALKVGDKVTYGAAGDLLQFDWSLRHTVIAITDAVILNLLHFGMPDGYAALPPAEHSGSFDSSSGIEPEGMPP